MTDGIDRSRRGFCGTAAITVAAAQLGMIDLAQAQGRSERTAPPAKKPGAGVGFAAIKQINAGVLNVGYAEAGPADGPVVILLHGWPYDIHTYRMSRRCWRSRAIGSSCRICAATAPRASCPNRSPRNGQQAALGQ